MQLKSVIAVVILSLVSRTKSAVNWTNNGTNYYGGSPSCAGENNVTALYEVFVRWSKEVDVSSKAGLIVTAVTVSLPSIASNTIIIHSVRVNRHMHTRTNYFIVNMACADLIINLGFGPYIVKYNFNLFAWFPGLFGQITCVAHQLIVFVGGACSVFSLVLITFDRLMAVLRPLKYKTYLPSSKYLIILTWLLSLGLSSSFIFSVTCLPILPNGVTYCLPKKVDHLLSAMIFSFLVVLVTVIALSIAVGYKLCTRKVPGEAGQHTADRTSRKVTYMILCVVLAFTVTWSPLNVIHYAIPKDKNLDVIVIHIIASITYSFAQLNGLFNLAVYFIFSENYRNAFKSLFIRVKSIFRRNTPIVHTCNNEQQFAQYTGGMINLAALKSSNE
ncbi:neuropeptide FF receptor 1 [Exaiptasia diaphana]|uniref:G-protein coupled receptors family 1 profile domain-containing protein n=1 Tax=Exaiptasia diaphana TaxID=2652724 RepID=A0A913XIZ2_EXADI|nr:neuropeptide FF receptor 1 [Exaiptasia diaphana]